MNRSVLIPGSGMMARNIGMFLLKKGYRVAWLSENESWLSACERQVLKESRRLQRYSDIPALHVSFHSGIDSKIPAPDIIIESTGENLDKKKKAFSLVSQLIRAETIVLSNSSSLLPSALHPRCTGCHFFFPVELTGVVELIQQSGHAHEEINRIIQELTSIGITPILQSEQNAFVVNRLLLPLQAEVFRLLMQGYDPLAVDKASVTGYTPIGALALIDSVGLDTISASVHNYIARMAENERAPFKPLTEGMEQLIGMKKLGKKNGDGLLIGSPLPWQVIHCAIPGTIELRLHEIFVSTCMGFIADGSISTTSLNTVLSSVFHSEESFIR